MNPSQTNLTRFPGTATTPTATFEAAKDWGFTDALIIGYDTDGALMVMGTDFTAAEALWLLEAARARCLVPIHREAERLSDD